MKPTDILRPEQRRQSKAYLVNELRKAVHTWRIDGYLGVTPTTRRLIQFWFCQREAIKTMIYVYKMMKKRNFIYIARDFGSGPIQCYDPTYDQYPRYAFKMATDSGKTFAMALSIVWQYFIFKELISTIAS